MSTQPPKRNSIIYKQAMSRNDWFRYIKAVSIPLGIFLLSLVVIQSFAGFGTKLVAPMTAIMWTVAVIGSLVQPSHRKSILTECYVAIAGYLAVLYALKTVIAMMSGVSSEMLMQAFGQAIPATSGSAISGWLQTLMWITSVMTPIGFIAMQVKRMFSFRRNESTQKTFDRIRGIRPGAEDHLR